MMKLGFRAGLIAIALALASTADAQNLRRLTRATAITGANDSLLTLVSDSAFRTRALSGIQLFRRPSGTAAIPTYSFALSTGLGLYRFGADTIGFATAGAHSLRISGGASPTIAGGAGNMTLISGTGNSRQLTIQTTSSAGAVQTAVRINEQKATLVDSTQTRPGLAFLGDSLTGIGWSSVPYVSVWVAGTNTVNFQNNRINALNGTATIPAYAFINSGQLGMYRFGADTLGFVTGVGVHSLRISGGASPTIAGGAGNMTLLAGTGVSRTLTLQATNASSVATTFLTGTATGTAILGTTTNDNASAGNIGEYVTDTRAAGSSLTLTTATTLTVDSISLTAGDWDVSGTVAYTFGATTSYTNLTGGISTTTNVLGALGTNFDNEIAPNVPTAGADAVWVTPVVRVSQAATAYVYLVAQGTFTVSTLKGYGAIRARRIR